LKNSIRVSDERAQTRVGLSEWLRIDNRNLAKGSRTSVKVVNTASLEFFNRIDA